MADSSEKNPVIALQNASGSHVCNCLPERAPPRPQELELWGAHEYVVTANEAKAGAAVSCVSFI